MLAYPTNLHRLGDVPAVSVLGGWSLRSPLPLNSLGESAANVGLNPHRPFRLPAS